MILLNVNLLDEINNYKAMIEQQLMFQNGTGNLSCHCESASPLNVAVLTKQTSDSWQGHGSQQ